MSEFTTAAIADACVRLAIPLRAAPPGLTPLVPGAIVHGRARPVRHFGSVDVFLEAIGAASAGEILVIDNGGRTHEGCIGDLVVLEAQQAGFAAIAVWGAHRDTSELRRLGLPVFSYGNVPNGPVHLRARTGDPFAEARFGACVVLPGDVAVLDDDGAVFVAGDAWEAVRVEAERIRDVEQRQAARARQGASLREQFGFREYLERRAADPSVTFRDHLRQRGGAVEE